MLQQTRVETVKDYYRRFMAQFPTPTALATAPLSDVLSLWSGLGYYSRARNLHLAAREIHDKYGGRFPQEAEAIHDLPGIGPYTAGAIRSIAFGQSAPILDGNVIRVLCRLYALDGPQEEARTKKHLWSLAQALVPEASDQVGHGTGNDPGDFNQGLMELGATVCLPQRPLCLVCPLSAPCQGRKSGDPERFPTKKQKRPVPVVEQVSVLLVQQAFVLLLRRRPVGLFGGLFEPPTGEAAGDSPTQDAQRLVNELCGFPLSLEELRAATVLPPLRHVLSHRELRITPVLVPLARRPQVVPCGPYEESRWIGRDEPSGIGLSSWVTNLLARAA